MALAEDIARREETEHAAARRQNAMDFGQRARQIDDVLQHLVVYHQIERLRG
jgi:hypothetical protein